MTGLYSERFDGVRSGAVRGLALAALLALAACGSTSLTSQPDVPPSDEAAPIALTPKTSPQGDGGGNALTAKVEDGELRKAIERYRITKQRGESTYDFAGVDLTGDGRPEALVLFTGADWCQKTGCSLVIFQREQVGYKAVSHITSVHGPVLAGRDANFGWRDLIVKTGGGGAPSRAVRLVFAGKGYPANALLQPEASRDQLSQAQQILVETATAASPASGTAAAPPPGDAN
jgi:hypothetical protein